jgi:DNA mismatch repair protein MSH6
LSDLAEKASFFETGSVAGLLRSVEDLRPYLQNIRDMFEAPTEDASELVPQQGKDEEYDEISGEINQIERDLSSKLRKFEKTLGSVYHLAAYDHTHSRDIVASRSSFGIAQPARKISTL